MEHIALRQSTSRLKRRMEELDRSFDDVEISSCQSMMLYLFFLGQMLETRSPSMTCGHVLLPLSLSLIVLAVSCFFVSKDMRLLRRYSAEMERVGAELRENRRRLLELGMGHDAFLAEIAGMWEDPGSTTLACARLLSYVVLSVLATGAVGCDLCSL